LHTLICSINYVTDDACIMLIYIIKAVRHASNDDSFYIKKSNQIPDIEYR